MPETLELTTEELDTIEQAFFDLVSDLETAENVKLVLHPRFRGRKIWYAESAEGAQPGYMLRLASVAHQYHRHGNRYSRLVLEVRGRRPGIKTRVRCLLRQELSPDAIKHAACQVVTHREVHKNRPVNIQRVPEAARSVIEEFVDLVVLRYSLADLKSPVKGAIWTASGQFKLDVRVLQHGPYQNVAVRTVWRRQARHLTVPIDRLLRLGPVALSGQAPGLGLRLGAPHSR